MLMVRAVDSPASSLTEKVEGIVAKVMDTLIGVETIIFLPLVMAQVMTRDI